ncbi:MAG TPA: hypothetical protein VFN27_16900 [Xanthobacteraceae bacterium]|nr:hypothetical protein [Xanthobacteraceae bacterium]
MPIPKLDDAINDFSAGELDPDVKRSGSPLIKMGGRQMVNWRTLSSHKKANRPGRFALFLAGGRVEEIAMQGGSVFFLAFAAGSLKVFNAAGAQVFSTTVKGDGVTAIPWTAASLGGITWAQQSGLALYVAYPDGAPNNVPQILTWDGVSQTSTWTLSTYAETVQPGGQKRTLFFRISPQNIFLRPNATSGTGIDVFASVNVFVAGMVGTRMRYCNKQILITSFVNAKHVVATIEEQLPLAQILSLNAFNGAFNAGDVVQGSATGATGVAIASTTQQTLNTAAAPSFVVGDQVTGGTSGAVGIVTSVSANSFVIRLVNPSVVFVTETVTNQAGTSQALTSAGASSSGTTLVVQILPNSAGNTIYFIAATDTVIGPGASATMTSLNATNPQFVGIWDDEVMNAFRGYPSSVFFDQNRLGLGNFPSVPSGLAWSAVGLPLDLYPDAFTNDAIFDLVPDQATVLYTIPGMESSEFVFTDKAIYYIPINVQNPLKPGSVAFNKLSDYGCMPGVQPRRAEQSIIYMKAGGTQVGAVQAPGAYYRPYVVDSISEIHSHLFTASPAVAIAIPSGPTQFEELYLYIALANGTAVVGRYTMRNGLLEPGPEGKPSVGWGPWNGGGVIGWIAARQGDVIFTASYGAVSLVEKLDATQYLDAAISVNNPPIALQAAQPASTSFVGNMTTNGGLAAAFNGTRVQAQAASADSPGGDGYVGEQFTTPQAIGLALVWPASDVGFAVGGSGNITLELRGKQTAPISATDGTLLKSITLSANQTTGPVAIDQPYSTTTWAYAWIHVSRTGASAVAIAQVLFQTGPLWWLANGTVTLVDNARRFMGTYNVDANGELVPQNIGGENIASLQLVAGQPWTAVFEPFLPHAPGGADQQQRMRRRKVAKGLVSVENSTGFVFGTRRVPAYFVGDDVTQPAPLREGSYQIRPRGRTYDPRLVLTKDTPGSLTVVEYGFEVTV